MTIFLYVLDTLADWEISYLTAELNSRRFFNNHENPTKITKIGSSKKMITTMGGLSISPDACTDDITFESGDVLILPGADTWLEDDNTKILNLVPALLDKGVTVAAICGATVALAKTGLLNSRKHTSNDKAFLKMNFPDYEGENLYINEPVVSDENLITATGLAPLEFSYEVLKKTNTFKSETLEAWYQLYKTRDAKYFYAIMDSLQ